MSQITLTLTTPGKKLTKQERMKRQARLVLEICDEEDDGTEIWGSIRAKAMKILSE